MTMFEPTSRYTPLSVATLATQDGRVIAYKRRRFLPESAGLTLLVETTLKHTERLDHVTARTLGDPEQFWRICDASDVMNPAEIPSDATRVLRVPVPQP